MANQLSLLCISFCFFAWFQGFFSIVHGDSNPSQPFPTPINRDLYHSSEDLMEEIKALVIRHPDKFTLDTIKARNKGYSAEIDVVTYCRRRQEGDDKPKFRILSFGQHGRELITSEVALRILSILSKEKFLPNLDHASVDQTLDNFVIRVVPMENLNGRRLEKQETSARGEMGDRTRSWEHKLEVMGKRARCTPWTIF